MLERLRGLLKAKPPETPQFDGAYSKEWWRTRDAGEASSAEGYWAHRTHPSRDAIAKVIAELPGDSLLEIGCHAGPTLWAIEQRKKFKQLAGIELSPTILEFTSNHLPQELGRPVHLMEGAADSLPIQDGSYDVIVTCMVLLCIGPEAIAKSLSEMLRVSRRWIVLGEPFSDVKREASPEGRVDPYPNTTYWIRNYAGMLNGRAKLVRTVHLSPEERMGHLDSVLVFEKL